MRKLLGYECLSKIERRFIDELEEHSSMKHFRSGEYIVKQGEYIRFLPIVLDGSVKVFSNEDALQFLLYYINPGEACIFSFAHMMNKGQIEFSAIAELDSDILLVPAHKVDGWMKEYPSFSNMILANYEKHYRDLLRTTKEITCYNLEQRLINYLKDKAELQQSSLLTISHQNIADDLATSREVISRLMLKISADNRVVQQGRKIKVL